jgi:hypothetical protein
MRGVLLAIDAEALRLPAFDASTLWYLVYFLLAVLTLVILVQWHLRRQNARKALSNRFMQIVMRRSLTRVQTNAVNDFFAGLSYDQQNEILLSQKACAHYLHQYLEKHTGISAADRVEIFDKLLPNAVSQIEIRSVADLRISEHCGVDIQNKSYLMTILKIRDNQVLLSSHERLPLAVPQKAHLYAYRPNLGGFLLDGEVIKSNGQSVIFQHTGGIDFRGDQHLMTQVALGFRLERWPHPDADVDEGNPDETTEGMDAFPGMTEKISDRAVIVRFHVAPPEWIIKRQDYWELTLDLPEKPLVCRVKLIPYKTHQHWMLRPVDLESGERNRLYNFIAANEPTREHF